MNKVCRKLVAMVLVVALLAILFEDDLPESDEPNSSSKTLTLNMHSAAGLEIQDAPAKNYEMEMMCIDYGTNFELEAMQALDWDIDLKTANCISPSRYSKMMLLAVVVC